MEKRKAINTSHVIDVSNILNESIGTRNYYELEGDAKFEGIKTMSELEGDIEIIKSDEGLEIIFINITVEAELECEKCLIKYVEKICVDHAEKTFYFAQPKNVEDINDLYLVDMKKRKIDLTEPLRQEIILHFPMIPVCSKSCYGICPECGKTKSKEKCDCGKEKKQEQGYKPFANLKQLINNPNGKASGTKEKNR